MNQQLIVSPKHAGQRLDVFCVAQLLGVSRSVIQRAIKTGEITLNEQVVKPRQVVAAGDTVGVVIVPTPSLEVAPPVTALSILYEDREVVVVDKPAGLVVHAGHARERQSLATWLVAHHPEAAGVGDDPARPGIVHRLDKDTSGVVIMAKTQKAFEHVKAQFVRHRAHKEYVALVFGVPGESKGRINRALLRSKRNPLRRTIVTEGQTLRQAQGKEAITEWRLEEKFGDKFALLRVFPLTGRTHQIRAHLHFLGFPIVGDALYTFKRQRPPQGVQRQLLHAAQLTLTLPSGKRRTFSAPLPNDFVHVLESLRHGRSTGSHSSLSLRAQPSESKTGQAER